MSVEWGGGLPGGYLEWSLIDDNGRAVVDLSQYAYLSVRLANLIELPPGEPCDDPDNVDAFSVRAELVSEGGVQPAIVEADVSVEQLSDAGLGLCSASQYMRTIRFDLASFCDQGSVATGLATSLRIYFDDDAPGVRHRALIDSVEFTRDPLDPPAASCGSEAQLWSCAATPATLSVQERSCAGEPAPDCDPKEVTLTPVPLPSVELGGASFEGWVVHTPKGWVRNAADPTVAELGHITSLCAQACELEWSEPSIEAACDATGAFATPTFVPGPAVGAEHRIVTSQRDGSGLFVGESLACDLEHDCALAFDEDLSATQLQRPTPASSVLGRGEEYAVSLGGATKVTFITPSGSVAMPLQGTAGYSLSTDPVSHTRPFYLGSLALDGSAAVTVAATCPDKSSLAVDVDELHIEMLQPSFGVDSMASGRMALPRGSLLVQASLVVDGLPYTIRAVNDETVFDTADASGLAANAIDVDVSVPCGAGVLPVTARFDIVTTSVDARPPVVSITTPAEVACGTLVNLAATASDPDADLASVRWFLDDVLVTSGVSSVVFKQDHELRAVARDARGATTTATKMVTCN